MEGNGRGVLREWVVMKFSPCSVLQRPQISIYRIRCISPGFSDLGELSGVLHVLQ